LTVLDNVLTLEGNIVECGSYRCGTTVIIANYLISKGINKKRVYALDLFGDSSWDNNELEEDVRLGLTQVSNKVFTYNWYEYVKKKIERLGLANIIIPIRGYFSDTLPNIQSKFCLAFIDCDLKGSISYCANTVWPNLPKDGVMLIDDYLSKVYRGAKIAVDEFVNKHKIGIAEHGMLNRLYYIRKDTT
jgi:macrocin-O-methyltransferase TylF-like protien